MLNESIVGADGIVSVGALGMATAPTLGMVGADPMVKVGAAGKLVVGAASPNVRVGTVTGVRVGAEGSGDGGVNVTDSSVTADGGATAAGSVIGVHVKSIVGTA